MRVSEEYRIVQGSAASTTTAARPPATPASRLPPRCASSSATGSRQTVSSRTAVVPVPNSAIQALSSR
jgi:hypothetical protein